MILALVLLSYYSAVLSSPLRGSSLDSSPPLPEAKYYFREPLVESIVEFTRHLPKFHLPKFHNSGFEDQKHEMHRHEPHKVSYFATKQEPREDISRKPEVIYKVYKDEEVNIKQENFNYVANEETTEAICTTTEDVETTTFDYDEDLLNRMGVPPAVAASLLG